MTITNEDLIQMTELEELRFENSIEEYERLAEENNSYLEEFSSELTKN